MRSLLVAASLVACTPVASSLYVPTQPDAGVGADRQAAPDAATVSSDTPAVSSDIPAVSSDIPAVSSDIPAAADAADVGASRDVTADPCAAAAQARSTLGCAFVAAALPNSQLDPSFAFAVAVLNPGAVAARVRVEGGALREAVEVALAPGGAEVIRLPWVPATAQLDPNFIPCTAGMCSQQHPPARSVHARAAAYRVTATAPVAAWQFNPVAPSRTGGFSAFTTDASLLLPTHLHGTSYVVATWPGWTAGDRREVGGFAAVVATEDFTVVQITPTAATGAGTDVPAGAAGATQVYTLAAGDVLVSIGAGTGDLTGTTVTASRPVALFGGHDCGNVPDGRPACDHLEEQLPPVGALGRAWVVPALRDRPELPTYTRVIATRDGTVVQGDPSAAFPTRSLRAGESVTVAHTAPVRVTASEPCLVAQFMTGAGGSGDAPGDPSMGVVPPLESAVQEAWVYAPTGWATHTLELTVPAGALALVDNEGFTARRENLGAWDVLTATVPAGAHRARLSGGGALTARIMGIAPYSSYLAQGTHRLP